MKRGYPTWAARASRFVASPLAGLVTVFYAQKAMSAPDAGVFALGATAFGISAALAAICLTLPDSHNGAAAIHFAGEKLLHSTVLLVQLLMLTYVVKTAQDSDWIRGHTVVRFPLLVLLYTTLGIVSGMVWFCWILGFDNLNDQLWENWRLRMHPQRSDDPDSLCK